MGLRPATASPLTVCDGADGVEAARHVVQQLPDDGHLAVAAQRSRGDSLQRLRPLLQTAQHQPPHSYEERLHTGNFSDCPFL